MKNRHVRITLGISLLLSVLFGQDATADPANPRPFRYTQPDGSSVTLVLHGDEYFNWTTDTEGRVMERGADGIYRYTGASSTSIRRRAAAQAKSNRDAFRRENPARKIFPTGQRRFLIMLVEFRDKKFTTEAPNDAFHRLANQTGYSVNGSIGSISDYYSQNSYGAFQPVFDVVGPVTLDKSATDFPANDQTEHFSFARASFLEALVLADPDVDYSKYDLDGDGYIDTVYFIFPGEAQSNGGGPDTIWPHAWGFGSNTVLDGMRTSSYACSSELVMNYSGSSQHLDMCGIGTICHEFGHVIGLPDIYDTDYEKNGSSLHPGSYSLMAGGNHNNGGYIPANLTAVEKNLLGWMDLPMLEEGWISLPDIGNHPAAGYIPTDNEGEWFVFETRDGQGWDTGLSAGLVVFHLDRSDNMVGGMTAGQRWLYGDGINDYASHPCYTFQTASGTNNIPFPGKFNVTEHTFSGWSGNRTGYRMTGITYSNSTASFDLEYFFHKISGMIRDNYGNPLSDVTVSVAPGQKNPAYARGKRMVPHPTRALVEKAIASVQSNADGTYELAFDAQGDTYELYAEKDMYLPHTRTVSFQGGKKLTLDLELKLFLIGGDETIRKHNGTYGSSWGFGYENASISASVRFNPEELADYAGKCLSSVDVLIAGNYAEKLYVIVDVDSERVLFHQVDLTGFKWGERNTIDVSDEHFIIPEGKTLHIGYGIVNSRYAYPMASDSGPKLDGGFCYYSDVQETAHDWWEDIDANLLLGVNLSSPSTIDEGITLLDLGINYISPLPQTIREGDTIHLSLVKSPSNSPMAVKWYCDDEECSTSVRALGGTHTVRAVLSFKDGHTETVETQYCTE